MDFVDKLHAKIELAGGLSCALKHHPDDSKAEMQAVDFIYQGWGTDDGLVAEIKRETLIPVCATCAKSLTNNEWALQFCMNCANSKWIWKLYSERCIEWKIQWTPYCPKCHESFRTR